MLFRPVKLMTVNTTVAQDTAAPDNGAPGPLSDLVSYLSPTYGLQLFRLVYNSTGAAIPAGSTVVADAALAADSPQHDVDLSTSADPKIKVKGVAQIAIPDGHFAYVLCHGFGQYLPDAAVTQGGLLSTANASAAGRLDDTAVAGIEHCIIGYAVEAGGAAGTLSPGFFSVL